MSWPIEYVQHVIALRTEHKCSQSKTKSNWKNVTLPFNQIKCNILNLLSQNLKVLFNSRARSGYGTFKYDEMKKGHFSLVSIDIYTECGSACL